MKSLNRVLFACAVIVFLGCGDGSGLNCAAEPGCGTEVPQTENVDVEPAAA